MVGTPEQRPLAYETTNVLVGNLPCGEPLESLWRACEELAESLWGACGEPVESLWGACGEPLESLWRACGGLIVGTLPGTTE